MQRGSRRRLQRACEARIAELDLPTPLTRSSLQKRLAQVRGREIWIGKGELPPEITGVWIGAENRDYVYYRNGLAGCRLDQTIIHEFAHMICGHRSADVAERHWLRAAAPTLAADEDVQHVCMRKNYATDDEQEAEMLASLILARAEGQFHGRDSRSEQDTRAARVESVFHT